MNNLTLALLVLLLTTLSCTKENFPKYVVLSRLRVIALQTSTPETNPGAAVTITPYISDVNNSGPWTYSAEGCFDPGVSYGATPTCSGNATRTVLAASTTLTGTLLTAANVYTGNGDPITVSAGLTAAALTGRSAIDTYNGVNYIVVYTISNSAGESVKSFRRIVITETTKTAKNTNPQISDVLANGATLGTLAVSGEFSMSASYSAGSEETYTFKDSGGTLISATESLLTTWFVTDGELKYYRTSTTDVNTYKTPGEYPSSRKSAVLAVTRDSRGGVHIVQRIVH